jgi:DNA-binding transcriptional ArsR family regulator
MDYRESLKVLEWMAKNAKLSGVDARVLILIAAGANYKTSEFSASYDDMAKALHTSKQSVMISIKRLEGAGAIKKLDEPVGRAPANYKIRNLTDLLLLHEFEEFNLAWREWSNKRDNLFYDFEQKLDSVSDGCEECTDETMCVYHELAREELLSSPQGRAMRLWDSENQRPEKTIKKVTFIDIGKASNRLKKCDNQA